MKTNADGSVELSAAEYQSLLQRLEHAETVVAIVHGIRYAREGGGQSVEESFADIRAELNRDTATASSASGVSPVVRDMILRAAANANVRLSEVANGTHRPVIEVIRTTDPVPKTPNRGTPTDAP